MKKEMVRCQDYKSCKHNDCYHIKQHDPLDDCTCAPCQINLVSKCKPLKPKRKAVKMVTGYVCSFKVSPESKTCDVLPVVFFTKKDLMAWYKRWREAFRDAIFSPITKISLPMPTRGKK